nr:hypothetical protein [Kocuria rhizophila]
MQFDKDREAVAAYLSQRVAPCRRHFNSVRHRLEWLIRQGYYEVAFLRSYEPDFMVQLHERVSRAGHRFHTFPGAFTFYTS